MLRTTPWSVTTKPPKGRRKTIYLRARRTVNGVREEFRLSSRTTDEFEARRMAMELARDLNGMPVDDPTVLAVIDARIRDMERTPDSEDATLKAYRRMRTIVAGIPLAMARASELCRLHLLDAQAAIRVGGRKGREASTTNAMLMFAGACWHWAQERELVSVPWPKIKPLVAAGCPKRAYSDAEVDAVLRYFRTSEPHWYGPFVMLAVTGARLGDVLGLRAGDVIQGTALLRAPKTKEPMACGIPDAALALLPQREPGAYLFPSPVRTGRPLSGRAALGALRRALAAIGVSDPEWLDNHSFRRAWCAAAEEANVASHQAMAQTGHTRVEMFHRYASRARPRLQETAEKVHAHRKLTLGQTVCG